jgi:hypothetical protein
MVTLLDVGGLIDLLGLVFVAFTATRRRSLWWRWLYLTIRITGQAL